MKHLIKSLIVTGLLCVAYTASAANFVYNLGAVGTNLLVPGPVHINSITVANSGTNYLMSFYDSTNTVQLTNNIPGYTNITFVVQTNLTTQTDIFGVTTTNSYTVIRRTTNNVNSVNQSYRLVSTMFIPAASSQTIDFSASQLDVNGLLLVQPNGGTVTNTVFVNVDFSLNR